MERPYLSSKSVIQRKLKVDVSSRTVSKPDVAVIDGGGMLHAAIYWPTEGIVKDLIDGIEKYVCSFINFADVYLVFDRYFEFSIKSDTRTERINSLLRAHTLSLEGPLPRKDTCMSSNETKEQLINIISKELAVRMRTKKFTHKFVVTSKQPVPVETQYGQMSERVDLKSDYDEADYIIPQQVNAAINENCQSVFVICIDTDVFLLLCHHFFTRKWTSNVYMKDFTSDTTTITCIRSTVERHQAIIPYLLASYSLTGCDSVPNLHNIGKRKALSSVKNVPLIYVGKEESEHDYMTEGKEFIANCYGSAGFNSSKNR